MKVIFEPKRLQAVEEEVKKTHSQSRAVPDFRTDVEFIKNVKYWAQMPENEIETEALSISKVHVFMLTDYLCQNIYKLPTQNLHSIILYRLKKNVFDRILLHWFDFYVVEDYNVLLKKAIEKHPNFIRRYLKEYSLPEDEFHSWLNSRNVIADVVRAAIRYNKRKIPIVERLSNIAVPIQSALGYRCLADFFAYCDREEYLLTADTDLLDFVSKSQGSIVKEFLTNFLQQVETRDLYTYYKTGSYLRDRITGTADSKKCKDYLLDFPHELIEKYNKWLGYVAVIDSFSNDKNDQRLNFWRDYIPLCVQTRQFAKSECLVFEFEKYCIVEFTEKTMGPLYVYEKNDYKKRIEAKAMLLKNSELRAYMVHNDFVNRIVHNGDWKNKTSVYMSMHRIMK